MKRIRSMERNFDGSKLDKVAHILNVLGVNYEREEVIFNPHFSTKTHTRNPDFKIKTEWGMIILEVDGESIHGLYDLSETEKTTKRNADYKRAKIPFITLNEGEAKHYNLKWESLIPYLIGMAIQSLKAESFIYHGVEE